MQGEGVGTRTRAKSNSQGRRDSVSEITEFFQTQVNQNESMGQPKKLSKKEKEKNKEIKAIKDNIQAMINNDSETFDNTNGGEKNESSQAYRAIDHDENSQISESKQDAPKEGNNDNTSLQLEPLIKSCSIATQTNDDEILKAIHELAEKYQKMEDTITHPKNGLQPQLAKTQANVQQLYTDIHGAVNGLEVRMQQVAQKATENSERLEKMDKNQSCLVSLLEENKRLVRELQIMQGLVQKVTQQVDNTSNQILDLTKRGMEQNLILHGVDNTIEIEDPKLDTPQYTAKERCKYSALNFFKETLQVDLEIEDIWKAHRMGPYQLEKMRPLVVKVSYAAKDLIMENLPKLKGLSNPKTKQVYFIAEQIPEGSAEIKKQISMRMKQLKDINEKKPKEQKSQIRVVSNKILINGEVDQPKISAPQPSELFLDKAKQQAADEIQSKMMETDTVTERNSEFKAFALKVHSEEDVKLAYIAVAQRYPAADHIMMACAFRDEEGVKSYVCDDKEFGAGARIRKKIYENQAKNTAVFVLRRYGGVHLGFNRFSIIERITTDAIKLR